MTSSKFGQEVPQMRDDFPETPWMASLKQHLGIIQQLLGPSGSAPAAEMAGHDRGTVATGRYQLNPGTDWDVGRSGRIPIPPLQVTRRFHPEERTQRNHQNIWHPQSGCNSTTIYHGPVRHGTNHGSQDIWVATPVHSRNHSMVRRHAETDGRQIQTVRIIGSGANQQRGPDRRHANSPTRGFASTRRSV